MIKLSIIVPIYNEEDNIGLLAEQILNSVPSGHDVEIIFVDDGNSDN